jgi:RNA polymerase sigma-70 factor (ECF subfamily)
MGASDEEKDWVIASRTGDPAAIEALIAFYQRMLYSLTIRMTGSVADAEDLTQETFIHAFQQIGQFRGESSFGSWLYRIAVNKCLNWKKRERRRGEIHAEWSKNLDSGDAEKSVENEQIQEALLKLHPKQRAAIVLTIFQQLSHAEAARILKCSETTVSWRVFSAKGKLRRWLEAGGVKP